MNVPTDDRPLPVAPTRDPRLPPRWFILSAWVLHRALYSVTGGRLGLRDARVDQWGMLRLTTIGRRTGKERTAILGFLEDGPDLVTLAMNGWGDPEPAWWLNLQANPDALIVLPEGPRRVHGRIAVGVERERLWAKWVGLGQGHAGYVKRRSRETAVVVLEPVPELGSTLR